MDRHETPAPSDRAGAFGFPGQYDENGVDLSLIRANLKLTPTERARRGERARRAALRVAEIGRKSRRQSADRRPIVRVINLDDLITIKRYLGRPKDQASLVQLEAIKRLRREERT